MTTGRAEPAGLSPLERRFVDRHRIARLATADGVGAPHVVPIVYARVGTVLYFVVDDKPKRTRTGIKRLRNIAVNPHVALVIDDYDEDWSRLAFLLLHGRAALVTDAHEYTGALAALRRRYPQYEAMPLALATHPMVRITPERTYLWRADSPRR